MNGPYYNTARLAGDDLREAVRKAASQEDAIWQIYFNTQQAYSPSQILRACQKAGYRWPIISIRRAITNLTKDGKLKKLPLPTDPIEREKHRGIYGAIEHKWKAP